MKTEDSRLDPPLVTCTCCHGTGVVPLHPKLWRTLKRLRKAAAPATAKDLREKGLIITAINNRLTALEDLGFAGRAGKVGRYIAWVAVSDPQPSTKDHLPG